MDDLFEEIERRKASKEAPCVLCAGRGAHGGKPCGECFGYGIVLSLAERRAISELSNSLEDLETDRILNQEDFD